MFQKFYLFSKFFTFCQINHSQWCGVFRFYPEVPGKRFQGARHVLLGKLFSQLASWCGNVLEDAFNSLTHSVIATVCCLLASEQYLHIVSGFAQEQLFPTDPRNPSRRSRFKITTTRFVFRWIEPNLMHHSDRLTLPQQSTRIADVNRINLRSSRKS